MSVRVAVFDPLPVFRLGVMAALGDVGLRSEAPEDLLAWIGEQPPRVVLMTLRSADDWGLLARIHDKRPDAVIVAVLEDTGVPSYVRALRAGAVSALPRDAPPEGVREVFEAAVRGTSMVPVEVLRALASLEAPQPHDPDRPSPREIEWLQQLATGVTVAQLADRAGYSERAMYRMLRGLYARLNVNSRTEALMHARDQGWL